MAWPLIILAAVTLALGFFQGPLETFLTGHTPFPIAMAPAITLGCW